ncbi:MAG: ROK family protein [Caulobacteraceae bacterium]
MDLGGTKIAAAIIGADGVLTREERTANPGEYGALLRTVREMCDALTPRDAPLGMGVPGSASPVTGLIRNCNSTYINGRDLRRDLAEATGRQVRLANDANCFTLSEAVDGAAAGDASVFGVIIGTGVGGGLVIGGKLVEGAGGVGGEWGHIPLPWAGVDERLNRRCWCGLTDCMEVWASGPAMETDYGVAGVRAPEIVERARVGEASAQGALDRYISRLARGLAAISNVVDPHTIVLGGGMSNVDELYTRLPRAMTPYLFTDKPAGRIVRNRHGDASGVRGAAWLWPG